MALNQKKRLVHHFVVFRNLAVYFKIWIQRAMSWVTIANSGMILFLVLSKLQEYGVSIYITMWFIPLYIVVIILLMFLGYLEDKAGFFREEQRLSSLRNPYLVEISRKLDRIEKELKKSRKRSK